MFTIYIQGWDEIWSSLELGNNLGWFCEKTLVKVKGQPVWPVQPFTFTQFADKKLVTAKIINILGGCTIDFYQSR